MADYLLYSGSREGDSVESEQGLRILQEAFELCHNDILSKDVKSCETLVDVLKKFIKFGLFKFKDAYLQLQESGFIRSEGVSEFLVPVAECLLFHGRKEQDNEKSKEGFRILKRAVELCSSERQQQIYHVLNIASRYDVSKLIDFMQDYNFTASYTSSEDFYKCLKFHSLPTRNVNDLAFERARVEQELTERMQFAKIALKIMSDVDLQMISNEKRESHFKNICHLNKVFAIESAHVLTEDERRPFAEECLTLKEAHGIHLSKREFQDLEHIVTTKSSREYQQYYKEVCFLLKVRDHMIESGLQEQLKQNVQELKQHHWSKEPEIDDKQPEIDDKLATCLLAIPSVRESEQGLTLLETLVAYLEKQQYLVKGNFYYLNLLVPEFIQIDAVKQRSVAKQLCQRVLKVLEGPVCTRSTQFEAYREQFKGLANGSKVC